MFLIVQLLRRSTGSNEAVETGAGATGNGDKKCREQSSVEVFQPVKAGMLKLERPVAAATKIPTRARSIIP